MSRLALAAVLATIISACSFDGASAGGSDASVDALTSFDAEPDGPLAAQTICDKPNADVIACYDFEDTLDDGSGAGLHAMAIDPSGSGVAAVFVDGAPDVGRAMSFDGNVAAFITEDEAFNSSAFTIEAWFSASAFPATGEFLIWDTQGQHALILRGDGTLRCSAAGKGNVEVSAIVSLNINYVVACTISTVGLRLFVDGTEAGFQPNTNGLNGGAEGGQAIGADLQNGSDNIQHFEGSVSAMRLSSVERTPLELCVAAGRSIPNCPASARVR